MTGRAEPRWDVDFADGYAGELFAQWARDAIRAGASIEVKTDRESWVTGNIFIERQCRVSGQWVASGVDAQHTKSLLWAHIIAGPVVVFAPTAFVRRVAEKYGKPAACSSGSHPTRGVAIPIPQFVAALVSTAKAWAVGGGEPPLPGTEADPAAPFGRSPDGDPVMPWGPKQDGSARLQPGGRRAGRTERDGLWPEDGAA